MKSKQTLSNVGGVAMITLMDREIRWLRESINAAYMIID